MIIFTIFVDFIKIIFIFVEFNQSKTKMKRITATFKGKDGSLGYRNGKQYTLTIGSGIDGMIINDVSRPNNSGRCEYSSLDSFFDNWDNVQVIQL